MRKTQLLGTDVAITGVGVVCPLGYTRQEIASALRANESRLQTVDIGLGEQLFFGLVPEDFFPRSEALFHHILSPDQRRLARLDPGLLYGLWAAHEAMEEAQLYVGQNVDMSRVASTVSSSKGFLRCYLKAHELLCGGNDLDFSAKDLGMLLQTFFPNTLGAWLAQLYGFQGGILSASAACATGLVAILMGISLIRDGIADVVLAGSAECTRNPMAMAGFINMGAFSRERCRPFHRMRSGFNAGEGAAVFVLESLSHAQGRRAKPLAIIRAGDYRSEGYHITAVEPSSDTAEFAVRNTLRHANWEPQDVEYINAHGTGTPLNDQAEAFLIDRIFAPHRPLVSSLKGHIGHLLGASASVELALTLISLDAGFIPPTYGLDEPDPAFHLQFVSSVGENQPVRRFLKFALGFGGHVAVIAVERPA